MKRHQLFAASALLIMTTIFGGCGGGGTTTATATASLGGVAAIGAPIVGGTVTVKCAAAATVTATTSNSGAWTVLLPAGAFPCAASVAGGTANGATFADVLHSVAQAGGVMNITPLTDLLVARLSGAAPATWFANVSSSNLSSQVTSTTLANAYTQLTTSLASLPGAPTLPNNFNPVTTTFNATNGDPFDALLETYRAALNAAGIAHSAAVTNAAAGQALTAGAGSSGGTGSGGSGGSSSGGGSSGLAGDGVALNGADGVTGTIGQTAYTHTANVAWTILPGNGTGVFDAFKANGASFDPLTSWSIRSFPPTVGVHQCGVNNSANIQFTNAGAVYSTAPAGGACTIEVVSVSANAITGRFSATLINGLTGTALAPVTDGFFRLSVPNGGGQSLPAGEAGISFETGGQIYRLDNAISLSYEEFTGIGAGSFASTYVQLHTLPNQTGTFACDTPADPNRGAADYRKINV